MDDPVIRVNGKEFALEKAWPLKWKDVKHLRNIGSKLKDDGKEPDNLDESEEVIRFIMSRVDEGFSQSDIDEMTLDDVKTIIRWIQDKTNVLGNNERPT